MTRMSPFDRSQPVGVFDSGLGGLTVLHECLVTMPHEDFVYFGDTGHFPYGGRSREELTAFSLEMAEQLLREGAKLIVVACNTATAAALPALRAEYERFVEDFSSIDPADDAETFAAQTTLVHAWRRFPFIDPDLPDDLLPRDWPRRRAYELFRERHERWAPAAQQHFDELASD